MPELIWDGKYDANGKRAAVPKIALPFQTIEIVNEDNAARSRTLNLFAEGHETEWRNRLIWGDKKWVLPSLLPEFLGKVDLIYIDPPFDTGADFSFSAQIPDDPNTPGDQSQSFIKEPSVLEIKAYRDIWGGSKTHLDSYLKWFYETVVVLYDLLSPTGSIYVHLDWHVSHYAKVLLDEIFGYENFKNEIIWRRTFNTGSSKSISKKFPVNMDSILWFNKGSNFTFNKPYKEYSDGALKRYDKIDEQGRRFKWNPLKTYSQERLERLLEAGEAQIIPTSKYPVYKHYFDEERGTVVDNVWDDLAHIGTSSEERVNYSTQKPEVLLERIIKASSNPNDLVLDCFCGSGTTAAVAEKLGRRWITCDLGRFAIHTARKRFLGIPEVRPFEVQNLGKYERQAWRKQEIGTLGDEGERQKRYRQFILDLYRARPLEGYTWLHGVRNGRFVHIGSVDSPVSEGDVTEIAREWKRATGGSGESPATNGIDILGWEFAFELNDIKRQQAERANLQIAFKRIPREVMEKRAADSGEIQFFELAALELETKVRGIELQLNFKNFISPPDYLPTDIQEGITNWEQLVDYWAIDWNFQGDAFHNQWQSYRTRTVKTLAKTAKYNYESPGKYRVVVKVIDILGNDTTKMMEIEIK